MGHAAKCDVCDKLFPHVHGTVIIEQIMVKDRRGESFTSWPGDGSLEFCPKHSAMILDLIGKALRGLKRPKRGKS